MCKTYRIKANIDLKALKNNYRNFRTQLRSDTKICGVIKADAYGHGANEVAKALMAEGIDCFAVATVEEALSLRAEAIDLPIMVFGYAHPCAHKALIEANIALTVFRLDIAKALSRLSLELNKDVHIQINVDTGMNRLGLPIGAGAFELIQTISTLPGLIIDGLYTHFTKADELEVYSTHQQIEKFHHLLNRLDDAGIKIPTIHMANSAGALQFPGSHHSMVRLGIAIYGLYPSDAVCKTQVVLEPVMSLISHVILVKTVPKGQPISYGGTYITPSERCIATIPVGYADGYPRSLSNKGHVLIHGFKAPIVGKVCMDLLMVDVTDIKEVVEGDRVTLIGSDGDATITVEDLATLTGTINYEIVCNISKRVPRVYGEIQ